MAVQTVCDHCRAVVAGKACHTLTGAHGPALDFCRLECVSAWIAEEPKRQAQRDEMARRLIENPRAVLVGSRS